LRSRTGAEKRGQKKVKKEILAPEAASDFPFLNMRNSDGNTKAGKDFEHGQRERSQAAAPNPAVSSSQRAA